jgi:hypothetical protein
MAECKHTAWAVVQSPTDPEMYAVEGIYLVADHLPIEDARLIAAAPELLEALKSLVADEWSEMDDDDLTYEVSQGNQMVIPYIAARAAISKAEGRSHD